MPSDDEKPEENEERGTAETPAPEGDDAPATAGTEDGDEAEASPATDAEASTEEAVETKAVEHEDPSETSPAEATTPPPDAGTSKATDDAKKLTPGQRLAAQKAAKASQKSADKVARKEAEAAAQSTGDLFAPRDSGEPDEAELRVAETRSLVASRAKEITYVAVALAVLFLLWLGYDQYNAYHDRVAGGLLAQAVEAARAEVTEEAPPETDRSQRLTFRTAEAREREALARYRKVIDESSRSDAALHARLGIARILVIQGKLTEAKRELESVASLRGDDVSIGAQAIEGLGVIALEQRDFGEASQRFEALRRLDDERYQLVARYLSARTLMAEGKNDQAKAKLRELVDALGEPEAPRLRYVQTQAELLLQQLDPASARPRAPSRDLGGIDLSSLIESGQLSPELLQQLLNQQGAGQ